MQPALQLSRPAPRGPRRTGASQAERSPHLHAVRQQALEGRPELSPEDLLQLPGQRLSWFPGALRRGGGRGGQHGCLGTCFLWPPARRGPRASPRETQADKCLAAAASGLEWHCPEPRVPVSPRGRRAAQPVRRAGSQPPDRRHPDHQPGCVPSVCTPVPVSSLCSGTQGSRPLPTPRTRACTRTPLPIRLGDPLSPHHVHPRRPWRRPSPSLAEVAGTIRCPSVPLSGTQGHSSEDARRQERPKCQRGRLNGVREPAGGEGRAWAQSRAPSARGHRGYGCKNESRPGPWNPGWGLKTLSGTPAPHTPINLLSQQSSCWATGWVVGKPDGLLLSWANHGLPGTGSEEGTPDRASPRDQPGAWWATRSSCQGQPTPTPER